MDETELTPSMLPRIGVAIGAAALLCPALTLPLTVACLMALGSAAIKEARAAENLVPELSPASAPRRRTPDRTIESEDPAVEDSFPASDPLSWTPITGTGTRH